MTRGAVVEMAGGGEWFGRAVALPVTPTRRGGVPEAVAEGGRVLGRRAREK